MPSENQINERVDNIKKLLSFLKAHGEASRGEISSGLGLSWGCVSELSTLLLKRGVLIEEKMQSNVKGRKPCNLKINGEICFLGVDINKIGLNAELCRLDGECVKCYSAEICTATKEELLKSVFNFVSQIRTKQKNICGIGFAMQGFSENSGNLWTFPDIDEKIDFKNDIASEIDLPTCIDHDPECILCGLAGTSKEKNVMLLRIDEGIGTAVRKNGKTVSGDVFETGYFVVGEKGKRLHDLVSQKAINSDDDYSRAGKYLGITLGNICNFIKLDEIIMCGEFLKNYKKIEKSFNDYYKKTALGTCLADIKVVCVENAAHGAAENAAEKFGAYIS